MFLISMQFEFVTFNLYNFLIGSSKISDLNLMHLKIFSYYKLGQLYKLYIVYIYAQYLRITFVNFYIYYVKVSDVR